MNSDADLEPDQVIGRGGETDDPVNELTPAMPELSQHHRLLLLSIQPADQRGEQHPQEEHVTEGESISPTESAPEAVGPSYGTLRAQPSNGTLRPARETAPDFLAVVRDVPRSNRWPTAHTPSSSGRHGGFHSTPSALKAVQHLGQYLGRWAPPVSVLGSESRWCCPHAVHSVHRSARFI